MEPRSGLAHFQGECSYIRAGEEEKIQHRRVLVLNDPPAWWNAETVANRVCASASDVWNSAAWTRSPAASF